MAALIVALRIGVTNQPVIIGILWLSLVVVTGLITSTRLAVVLVVVGSALTLWPFQGPFTPNHGFELLGYLTTGSGAVLGTRLLRLRQDRVQTLYDRLAEQDAILGTLLASIPLITLDQRGLIQRANQAAADLFKAQKHDLVGHDLMELVPDFDSASTADPVEGYWQGQRTDGSSFPLSIQRSAIPARGGGNHVALHLSDLTRRHAADAQARELHTQLNKVWRLNSLGEMAATLAHELNQPLSAAATYLHASQSEMDRLGQPGENASRITGLAKAQLLRAGQIIRRMRDLLSLEVRNLDRERASSMVEDLSPVLTMIASARGVAIKLKMESRDDAVRADRIQFQQAIVNLVRNAVEATWTCSNPRVVVRGQALSETAYAIAVEDNGPGLPPEEVERMFQPMTSTKSGGMGLGLSVTRTIVERHGGRLNVAQASSGGAVFSFNLIRDPLDRDL